MKINLGNIKKSVIHQVGNKTKGEGVKFSSEESSLNEVKNEINSLLKKVFLFEDTYEFYFQPSLTLNPVYTFIKSIFENKDNFLNETHNISRYLYEKSTHPMIKSGEVCFVYLENCEIGGQTTDAICILKSETKETILQFQPSENGFEVLRQQGLSLKKLDKGCIIFNVKSDDGYLLSVVDGTKKGEETKYWVDDFLHIRSVPNSYHNTKTILNILTTYVTEEMPNSFDKTRSEQILMLNRGVKELKSKEKIDLQQMSKNVFQEADIQKDFDRYYQSNELAGSIELTNGKIEISKTAVRKGQGKMTTIKLDKNFNIQIHGGEKYIERGYDNDLKMSYYKLFFREEK